MGDVKMRPHKKIIVIVGLFVMFLFMVIPEQAEAAQVPLSISSCKLNGDGKKLTVKAKVKEKNDKTKKKLYLIGLDAYEAESGKSSVKPLKSGKVKGKQITFTVKYKSDMLCKKFVIAYKSGKKYQIISNAFYITNPEKTASYKGKGPSVTSKKGLQAEQIEDALELRTKHVVLNMTADVLFTTDKKNAIVYKYRGKKYYFNPGTLQNFDAQIKAYNKAKAKVTVILLLPNNTASSVSAMRYKCPDSAKFSSFKTSSRKGCEMFEAMMTFLAGRYSNKEKLVMGWILGNEINSPGVWNYGGGKSLTKYVSDYARAYRIAYNVVKSASKYSNVYVSLDHNWNLDADNGGNQYFTTKSTLDKFYKTINTYGKVTFKIAFHAYPQGLVDPVFWDDSLAKDSQKSMIVTFRNLSVLTKYVKKNFGKNYTIMLSEQSFNSTKGEEVQAAAYAYAYYMSEADSMIESFIYGRHFDNWAEMKDNCYWGLRDASGTKRIIWDVFQYIDTKDSLKFTKPLLPYINLNKWEKISGYKKSKYEKMESIRQKPTLAEIHVGGTSSVSLFWTKCDYADGYEITRNDEIIKVIWDVNTCGYNDNDVSAGESYSYKVRSFKVAPSNRSTNTRTAVYSGYSNKKKVTVSAGRTEWDEVSCTVDGGKIKLTWKNQDGVSGYQVARSTAVNGTYESIADVTKNTYTDDQTKAGTTYYYKVRAYVTKNGGNHYGEYSDALQKKALIQLSVRQMSDSLEVSWNAWQGATDYQVYCRNVDDDQFVKQKTVKTTTYNCSEYKDPYGEKVLFETGNIYEFKVRAVLADGTKTGWSNVCEFELDSDLVETQSITEETELLQIPMETEMTEEMESTESTETTETAEDTEPAESTEETESTEMTNETESTETTGKIWDTENTETTGKEENTESTEITGDTESTEKEENTESTETTGDTESMETTESLKK